MMKYLFSTLLLFLFLGEAAAFQSTQPEDTTQYGYLKIVTDAKSYYLVQGNQFDKAVKLNRGDSIQVPVGRNRLKFVSPQTEAFQFVADISADSTTTKLIAADVIPVINPEITAWKRLEEGYNARLITDPNTKLTVDGTGYTGTQELLLDPGRYTVKATHTSGETITEEIEVKAGRINIFDLQVALDQARVKKLMWFPGIAQLYKRQPQKGFILAGTVGLTALGAITTASAYLVRKSTYESDLKSLLGADGSVGPSPDADRRYRALQNDYDQITNLARTRNILIGVAAAAYAINIWDALREPKSGYQSDQADGLSLFVSPNPVQTVTFSIRF